MTSPATLLLIRHGQIRANVTGHWHGTTDSPLTPEGRQQAERTARHLAGRDRAIGAIYTSPLQRTRHTAHAIQGHHPLELTEEPSLREYGLGELEGVLHRKLRDEHRLFQRVAEDPGYAPEGGESILAVANRMSEGLVRIADRHPGEVVVIVSHGAAIAIALAHFLDADPLAWTNYRIENCSMSELVLQPTPRLVRLNDTEHLQHT